MPEQYDGGGMSIVRLKAENIDLRQQLNEAHSQLQQLRQELSSHTVHVHQVGPRGGAPPRQLDDLAARPAARDVVSCEEYDKLEVELEESLERLEELKRALTAEQRAHGECREAGERLEAELANLRTSLAAEQIVTAEAVAREKKQLRVVSELRNALERCCPSSTAPAPGVGEDNAGSEAQLLADFAAAEEAASAGGVDDGGRSSAVDELKDAAASVEQQQQQHLAEEAKIRELQAEHEEQLFLATAELQETIDQLRVTVSSQQEELQRLREEMAETLRTESERDAAVRAMEQAVAERNIATRAKEIATNETAHLMQELRKRDAELANVRRGAVGGSAGSRAGSGRNMSDDADGEPARSRRDQAALLHSKDADIAKLQNRVAELEVERYSLDAESHRAVSEAVSAQQQQADAQVARLEGLLEQEKLEHALCRAERDKALTAGRRAFLERNSALDESKKLQHLRRIQQERKETNTEMLREVTQHVMANYDAVVEKLDVARSPEEVERALYETLFEYERRLWHLNNDVLSLRAIVDIREADTRDRFANANKVQQEEIDLLRGALQEARDALGWRRSGSAGGDASASRGASARFSASPDLRMNNNSAIDTAASGRSNVVDAVPLASATDGRGTSRASPSPRY